MRYRNLVLVPVLCGTLVTLALVACKGSSGPGGAPPSSPRERPDGGEAGPACALPDSCKADHECLGLTDNSGKTVFGLRIMELQLTKPSALSSDLLKLIVGGATQPTIVGCRLNGQGTFSWLLQFDLTTGKLKTGGAKPVGDVFQGQSFVDEMIDGFHIEPITYDFTLSADGSFTITEGLDVVIPIYLSQDAANVVLLPIKDARFVDGKLSQSQNCIGSYNADGLDPALNCLPDNDHPAFITGADLKGHILLDVADKVVVKDLQTTLCAVLAESSAYSQVDGGLRQCTRDSAGNISFHGDFCDATKGPATADCYDSMALGARFAASAIPINN